MALKPGTRAPSFSRRTVSGQLISLDDYAGKSVVVYFFRRVFTRNCAIETKGFRDNYDELREHGVEVIGVSADAPETHCEFGEKFGVAFPLVADEQRWISRAYDVLWPLGIIGRYTFVLDEAHVIAAVMHHEFQANRHLDDVMRFVRGRRAR